MQLQKNAENIKSDRLFRTPGGSDDVGVGCCGG